MNRLLSISLLFILYSCTQYKKIQSPPRTSNLKGSDFYSIAAPMNWQQRDSLAVREILHGNLPSFLNKFVPVHVYILDSASGKTIRAIIYVAPDYLSVGTDDDWARVNITPHAAQKIADSLHCFLPTKKIVDDIYATGACTGD